jgi:hypothetical protein
MKFFTIYGHYGFGTYNQNSSFTFSSKDLGIYVNDEGIEDIPSLKDSTQDIPSSFRSIVTTTSYYNQQTLTLHCCIKHDAEEKLRQFKSYLFGLQNCLVGSTPEVWHGYQGTILLWDDDYKPRSYFNYFNVVDGITTENWGLGKSTVSFNLTLQIDTRKYLLEYDNYHILSLLRTSDMAYAIAVNNSYKAKSSQELVGTDAVLTGPDNVPFAVCKPFILVKGYGTFSISRKFTYASGTYISKLFSFTIKEGASSSVQIDCETLYTYNTDYISFANGTTPKDLTIVGPSDVSGNYKLIAEYDSTITSIIVEPNWYVI